MKLFVRLAAVAFALGAASPASAQQYLRGVTSGFCASQGGRFTYTGRVGSDIGECYVPPRVSGGGGGGGRIGGYGGGGNAAAIGAGLGLAGAALGVLGSLSDSFGSSGGNAAPAYEPPGEVVLAPRTQVDDRVMTRTRLSGEELYERCSFYSANGDYGNAAATCSAASRQLYDQGDAAKGALAAQNASRARDFAQRSGLDLTATHQGSDAPQSDISGTDGSPAVRTAGRTAGQAKKGRHDRNAVASQSVERANPAHCGDLDGQWVCRSTAPDVFPANIGSVTNFMSEDGTLQLDQGCKTVKGREVCYTLQRPADRDGFLRDGFVFCTTSKRGNCDSPQARNRKRVRETAYQSNG